MDFLDFFLYSLFGTLALFFTCINTQSNSLTVKRKILIFLFIFFMSTIVFPFIGQLSTLLVIIGICIFLIYKRKNKITNLVCFFLGYLLYVCVDYIYTNCIYILFHKNINEMRNENLLLFSIFYIPFLFFITKLLGWLFHKKLKIEAYVSSSKFMVSTCVNLLACTSIFIFGIVYGDKLGYPPKVILFNGILFTVYFILSNVSFFMTYRTLQKEEQLNAQIEQYKNLNSYTKEVERLYHNMHAFKHDYLDILSSLNIFIEKQDMQGLSFYFYKNILPLTQEMISSDNRLGLLSFLNDDAVKSIISTKLMIAMEKEIDAVLEIRETINICGIERIDLIRILGILLNNAIDAASMSNEKKLIVAFIKDELGYSILIRNTTAPILLPISALCTQYVSTKGEHDGIGLYTAKNILDSYKNIRWKLEYNPPYFLVEIKIKER